MLHGAGCLLSCHGTDIVITKATGTLPRAPIAARLDLSSLAWEFEVASIMHRLSRASPVERVAHVVSAQPADAPEVLLVYPPGSRGAGRDCWHHPCSDHLRDILDAAGKPEIAKLIRATIDFGWLMPLLLLATRSRLSHVALPEKQKSIL